MTEPSGDGISLRLVDANGPEAQQMRGLLGTYIKPYCSPEHYTATLRNANPSRPSTLPPDSLCLICESSDLIIGAVSLLPIPLGSSQSKGIEVRDGLRVGEVKRMVVREGWQGSGTGKKLLSAMESEAMRHGYSHLVLETLATMKRQQRFYERHGWTPREAFGGYGDESVFYEKSLLSDKPR